MFLYTNGGVTGYVIIIVTTTFIKNEPDNAGNRYVHNVLYTREHTGESVGMYGFMSFTRGEKKQRKNNEKKNDKSFRNTSHDDSRLVGGQTRGDVSIGPKRKREKRNYCPCPEINKARSPLVFP